MVVELHPKHAWVWKRRLHRDSQRQCVPSTTDRRHLRQPPFVLWVILPYLSFSPMYVRLSPLSPPPVPLPRRLRLENRTSATSALGSPTSGHRSSVPPSMPTPPSTAPSPAHPLRASWVHAHDHAHQGKGQDHGGRNRSIESSLEGGWTGYTCNSQ
jgi:hypothetical protein